ncbi:hypothetical protein U3A55_14965 [Salarchaeum sp. III]|uniref:hypothetical protein n=1 Tax=Salarchaeum sp. III TaxID=3107927 RepID=UPI002ED96FAC
MRTHVSRRSVVVATAAALGGLAGCLNRGRDCARPARILIERVYPHEDYERQIVPVRYRALTSAEQKLAESAMEAQVEPCLSEDAAARRFVERVRTAVDEQGSIRGGASHAYLLWDGAYYNIRLVVDGELITA